MIYLDSSVALAAILAEPRRPSPAFWQQQLTSSRLLEYEVVNRLNVRGLAVAANVQLQAVLTATHFIDMTPNVLARALQPFPVPVRTLDGLHLATMEFLRRQGQTVELATYDRRLEAAAVALGFALAPV